jgi:hypothetical protein
MLGEMKSAYEAIVSKLKRKCSLKHINIGEGILLKLFLKK